jgi:hypothetical protein
VNLAVRQRIEECHECLPVGNAQAQAGVGRFAWIRIERIDARDAAIVVLDELLQRGEVATVVCGNREAVVTKGVAVKKVRTERPLARIAFDDEWPKSPLDVLGVSRLTFPRTSRENYGHDKI